MVAHSSPQRKRCLSPKSRSWAVSVLLSRVSGTMSELSSVGLGKLREGGACLFGLGQPLDERGVAESQREATMMRKQNSLVAIAGLLHFLVDRLDWLVKNTEGCLRSELQGKGLFACFQQGLEHASVRGHPNGKIILRLSRIVSDLDAHTHRPTTDSELKVSVEETIRRLRRLKQTIGRRRTRPVKIHVVLGRRITPEIHRMAS